MNGLAYVGKISEIIPIDGADKIVSAVVDCGVGGRWYAVTQKSSAKVGALVRVFLPDSILPESEETEFLRAGEFRIRQMRLKGARSEVLILPYKGKAEVGTDITEAEGVTKYSKPYATDIQDGEFPSYVPKTDEPLYQGVPDMLELLKGRPWYASLKLDGTSGTIYRNGDDFGVCSRMLRLARTYESMHWQVAFEHELETSLPDGIAIQYELVGPKIQRNAMGLSSRQAFVFNAYDIASRRYLDWRNAWEVAERLGMRFVPIVTTGDSFGLDIDTLVALSDQNYLDQGAAEGVVIRPQTETRMPTGDRLSFKVINLKYRD